MIRISALKAVLVAEAEARKVFEALSASEQEVYLETSLDWFKKMSPRQRLHYLKHHPHSKHKHNETRIDRTAERDVEERNFRNRDDDEISED